MQPVFKQNSLENRKKIKNKIHECKKFYLISKSIAFGSAQGHKIKWHFITPWLGFPQNSLFYFSI